MELKKGTKLFRYDLETPSQNWDSDYHSLEYSETLIDGFSKNHMGLLFFFDNEEVACNTAKVACKNIATQVFQLTTTEVLHDLNILNLTGCHDPLLMIQKLNDVGIDIMNDSFRLYSSIENPPLSILKDAVNYNLCVDMNPWDRDPDLIMYNTLLLQQHLSRPGYPYTILGQMLTDYANGIIFKKELETREYNGYSFDESIGGHTICLLDSQSLSQPQSKIINI